MTNPMNDRPRFSLAPRVLLAATVVMGAATAAWAQGTPDAPSSQSLLDLLRAGGWVGYFILLLSVAAIALLVNVLLALREDRLIPPPVRDQAFDLAQRGRFVELHSMSKTSDSVLGRLIDAGFNDGKLGVDAIREAMQRQGEQEMTSLHQRVSYLGLVAAIAPVLGLLGTVTGMMSSFNILGQSRGAARPDELAVGISEALVTTCLGLILAVPMMGVHLYLRNRVTRVGQDLSAACDRLLRLTTASVEARTRTAAQAAPAPPHAQPPKAAATP